MSAEDLAAESGQSPLAPWFAEGLDEQGAWQRLAPGPGIDELAARLSTVPQAFLEGDGPDVLALAGDVFDELRLSSGVHPLVGAATRIAAVSAPARIAAGLGLWLYASEELVGPFAAPLRRDTAAPALLGLALRLAPIVAPSRWLIESERREEAVRTFLLWGGMLPAGESLDDARARFELCDSLARDEALRRALDEHEHRLEVVRRLEAARAREAAARYGHE
ncbi:phosphohydrolase [Gryllotalpicola koreensis]|uniref:Phosphohydrolase n=1 Tax=Gryllotalpicola koreensis TaxID=993086 RepID=A0ABP7ZQ37_9MICO